MLDTVSLPLGGEVPRVNDRDDLRSAMPRLPCGPWNVTYIPPVTDKRTFEHRVDGKFWEIWIEGANVYTRHGRLGATGQTKLKPGDATMMEKMIKEKVGAGYTQTGGKVEQRSRLDNKELKRHLAGLKPLTDDPAYLVLADWLQSQNHPWGELIALQAAATANPKKSAALTKQADKLLRENRPAILGALADAEHSHFDWFNGFIRRAVVGTPADLKSITKAIATLLDEPVASMVETLVIGSYRETFKTFRDWGRSTDNLIDPWTDLDAIAKVIPDRIRRLGFGGWPAPAAAAYVQMPNFTKLSNAFPKLVALELTGWSGSQPGKLVMPELTELAVRFAQATGDALRSIVTAKLPKLTRLDLWLGGSANVIVDEVFPPDDYDEDNEGALRYPETYSAADLEAMDGGWDSPSCDISADDLAAVADANLQVSHLRIGAPQWGEELIAAVLEGKLIKRLKTLGLAGGTFNKAMVKQLTAAKQTLAHLDAIEIDAEMETGDANKLAGVANLKVTVPDDAEQFCFRYVATME